MLLNSTPEQLCDILHVFGEENLVDSFRVMHMIEDKLLVRQKRDRKGGMLVISSKIALPILTKASVNGTMHSLYFKLVDHIVEKIDK